MQNLFNVNTVISAGTSVDPNWKYIKSGLRRNIFQTVNYYRSRNFSVKNSHILVKLLESANVSIFNNIESFYNNAQREALRLASILNITSSISKGSVFNGSFFGQGSKEILIASDEYQNPIDLENNWKNIRAVNFLDHFKSDTSLLLANGIDYSGETGYCVIDINIPALLVQYRCWLKEQKEIIQEGATPYPTTVFVYKYVLPNMLYSQLDVVIFNRLINLANGSPMGSPNFRHAFNLINYDDKLDKALQYTLKRISQNDKDFYSTLREVPLVNHDNLLLASRLSTNAPTRQLIWAELIARLKTIYFAFNVNLNHGVKTSMQEINYIKLYLDRFENGNGLETIPDRRLVEDIESEILRLRLLLKIKK